MKPLIPLIRLSPRRRQPAILAFHDVRDRTWFEGLLVTLARQFEIVPFDRLIDERGSVVPDGGRLALTFDDGCRSIATIVEPVASALNLPFTIFVCGEVMSGGPVLWPDRAMRLAGVMGADRAAALWGWRGAPIGSPQGLVNRLKELDLDRILAGLVRGESELAARLPPAPLEYLDADEVRRLATHPLVTIGSHSHRHPILSRLAAADQAADLEQGVAALEGVSGRRPRWFAYPNGKASDYDATTIEILRRLGFIAAVTTDQRPLGLRDDRFRLPRLGVSEGDSAAKLEIKWALPWFSRGDHREADERRRARHQWDRP
jgi:peptidoglycan/xylan/chitin deacetylase (PgdA/CDA1 family)